MTIKKIISHVDYFLILIVVGIFTCGMITIISCTNVLELGLSREVKLQLFSFLLGLVLIFVMLWINYRIYHYFYWVFYALAIIFLLMVYIPGLGVILNDARSWIKLGKIYLQTSELSKLAYILFLSQYAVKLGGTKSLWNAVKMSITLLPILLLLLKQPDLGTALVFVAILFGILFISGMRYWLIGAGIAALYFISPYIYPYMAPHQKSRIDAFLNPQDLTLPGNYHVYQSKITLGSGKMYGRGMFEGVYHKLNYLPVKESDFIFPVFVEEFGFVGGAILIFFYLTFILRLLYMSSKIADPFGANIIIGVMSMFLYQILQNIGMTMGAMPVTGITLPFMSYGSTSIVTSMLALGLVQQVYTRRNKKQRIKNEFVS